MKNIKVFLMASLMMLLFTTPVYAHKMLIEPVKDGVIKVNYDDGSFSERTEVILYDKDDNELERGKLDEEGQFKYDNDKVDYIVAEDGLGHRAEWKVGEEVKGNDGGSKFLKIGVVLLVIGAVGGISYSKKNKGAAA